MTVTRAHLIDALASGEAPPASWRVGTEYETFVYVAANGARLPYQAEGGAGIRDLLEAAAEQEGWALDGASGRPIGAYDGNASITLEPGGQFELSGAPFGTIQEMADELHEHTARLRQLSERFGVRWLWAGMDPLSDLSMIPWMPKPRYGIMRAYLPTRGQLALQMMQATCTVQANLDFQDEVDMGFKLRVSSGLSSIVNALFANSPYRAGQATGWLSTRGHIWTATDPDRCGLPGWIFDGDLPTYDRYVDYALKVPLFFIVRDGEYLNCAGLPFEDFLSKGFQGHEAREEDWALHLSTLFPDVRVKAYLEMRSADCVPPHLLPALPALWKGVLYDADACNAAWDLVSGWTPNERQQHRADACRSAFSAPVPQARYETREVARELLKIARYGLDRLAVASSQSSESEFLEPLEQLVARGKSLARESLESLGRSPSLDALRRRYIWSP